jgi:hypothetical protein
MAVVERRSPEVLIPYWLVSGKPHIGHSMRVRLKRQCQSVCFSALAMIYMNYSRYAEWKGHTWLVVNLQSVPCNSTPHRSFSHEMARRVRRAVTREFSHSCVLGRISW